MPGFVLFFVRFFCSRGLFLGLLVQFLYSFCFWLMQNKSDPFYQVAFLTFSNCYFLVFVFFIFVRNFRHCVKQLSVEKSGDNTQNCFEKYCHCWRSTARNFPKQECHVITGCLNVLKCENEYDRGHDDRSCQVKVFHVFYFKYFSNTLFRRTWFCKIL